VEFTRVLGVLLGVMTVGFFSDMFGKFRNCLFLNEWRFDYYFLDEYR
jgi:uncharacterized membrane protein